MDSTFSAQPDVSLKKFDRVIFGGMTTGMLVLLVGGAYALWLLKDAIIEAAQDTLKLGREPGLPGARLVKQYDLAEMDLCWRPDIQRDIRFQQFVASVKAEFRELAAA
jgi:hypothetical protein